MHSTAESGFFVDLRAGRYVVEPLSDSAGSIDRAAPFSIRIARRTWSSVPIVFDTGIRFGTAFR